MSDSPDPSPLESLRHAIDHAAHWLPAQGPIAVFVHHNTLHALESLPFDDAVQQGATIFGCQPYLTEDRYRDALGRGRIRLAELQAVVREELAATADQSILGLITRAELRDVLLQYPLPVATEPELDWFLAQTNALRTIRPEASSAERLRFLSETRRWVLRDLRGGNEGERIVALRGERACAPQWLEQLFDELDESRIESWDEATWETFALRALWHLCRDGVRDIPNKPRPMPLDLRPRDWLLDVLQVDSDALVHEPLIRFCAAFLDQGLARWPLPMREQGFFRAVLALAETDIASRLAWRADWKALVLAERAAGRSPLESVAESLADLGIAPAEWSDFLAQTLLALRGWAGMFHQVETRGDRVALPIPEGSLVEFLAIRLLLDRAVIRWLIREHFQDTAPLAGLRQRLQPLRSQPPVGSAELRAFRIFQLAQLFGWAASDLVHLRAADWETLVTEIESFSSRERRRTFHLAYERRLRTQTLDALAAMPRRLQSLESAPESAPASSPSQVPRFQAIFCIDEREESFRRHLTELAPDCETFGAAGFFSIPMYYRGAAEAYFVPLCPVVIRPGHWVEEVVDADAESQHRQRAKTRRLLAATAHRVHLASRDLFLGSLVSTIFGLLSAVPLMTRVLLPRWTAKMRRSLGRFLRTPPATRLHLERHEAAAGPENGHRGFAVPEMTDLAERLLRDIGLTRRLARLVFVIGHGSNSLNNPHKSAYDCGACGGSSGGPNGRAAAQILNDARVRAGLAQRGIEIPESTIFVGGFHNTCDDSVTLFDLESLPQSHAAEFQQAKREIRQTCERNAHERCRRFMSAPLAQSFEDARHHVEARSEDLAQPRPELGHATNAIAIVGRRERTRGLFLDRRAFLVSYDPEQDTADHAILARILAAVFPVCAGINLEYYFSHIDSQGFGCGSKLPHNLTGLLGVMDGALSDLRTGLPWQMVEIHEPVRLLMVIETTPAAMLAILERLPAVGQLCRNAWVQLATLDPDSQTIHVWNGETLVPYTPSSTTLPHAASSVDWYRGWREHLEFARIGPET
ncbi:UPF0753 protein Sinac_5055 OS=Singulisphaera acidiphila (strain ATCC BAA-1392 / DSM 18658 / VKM B-2454 / MOB10) GN=Sinac_5055 PE=3 SV=1: DUF2309 [Tuwongella immobilis]|uniref:Probable inorganic carbon transporter subunit DabA n=1 Tax=Tuwongella immobilis TaxID=692036 RepID=A0A6C2YIC1_9BACT|nr:DUF2309 domain-containing protein [Tuwongella immobilis]VIP01167.1 UPF0753 protein Sinac_5055 OS=Singulisphaera acidiphila (strain ATCC BAA-1392 / DSM 18658 / VKM B-2454 / MOB10) GN=Sinac_5055 PE=3 SV=1: DUF2309 [Tuwongella immobilis]VTR97760.1 UPF0753 protein Sinac_5055 OS=Singulisphaera acidiphila (strain ATCC BAA-1392 / DSM 18658 / VKM B-2454 / MOB10) GN=Sinac_5055 PE=3 SV=1: DUF2309 [Tuwongella immobilis]